MTRRQLIARVTGLNFCGCDCGCGQNNRLWWFPVGGGRENPWVPGWMNGAPTEESWEWLLDHEKGRRKAANPVCC